MNDNDLINYCESHCKTERALFSGTDVNRMIELAGYPDDYVRSVDSNQFFSLHFEMENLVKLARTRLYPTGLPIEGKDQGPLPTAKIIQFPTKSKSPTL